MINLLSDEHKKSLRAARTNIILRNYIFWLILVAIGIVTVFGWGYWVQMKEQARYAEDMKKFTAQRAQYASTQQTVKAFSDNLATARAILNNEVLFSDLMTTIARTLPSGTSLQSLTVSTAEFNKPITLTILTSSYDNAIATKNAFENSPAFEQANILTTAQVKDSKTKYNYTMTLNVIITKDAFVHGKAGS